MTLVLTASQVERNDRDLGRWQRKWAARGVEVEIVEYRLEGEGAASWGLTKEERQDIESSWPSR